MMPKDAEIIQNVKGSGAPLSPPPDGGRYSSEAMPSGKAL